MVDLIERYQAIGEKYKNLEYQLYNFHEAINLHQTKIPSLSISRSQFDDEIPLRFLGK